MTQQLISLFTLFLQFNNTVFQLRIVWIFLLLKYCEHSKQRNKLLPLLLHSLKFVAAATATTAATTTAATASAATTISAATNATANVSSGSSASE